MKRVVITGIGVVGPCGTGIEALWNAALANKSYVVPRQSEDPQMIPVPAAGFARDFQPKNLIVQRKSLKVMCRDIQMAVAASHLAFDDGLFGENSIVAERSGTCIGAGIFEHDPEEMADSFRASIVNEGTFDNIKFGAEGMSQLFPLWLLKYLPNMPACHITIAHGLRGPSNTLTADSAGSASALEESMRVILRGAADLMFTGGAESRLHGEGLLKYYSQGILAQSNATTYPIFSHTNQGIFAGEGGTLLILEELTSALSRGAKIYAEVLSFGSSADTAEISSTAANQRAQSIGRLMQRVLHRAQVEPREVDALHLNARGVLNEDQVEAEAIETVFGNLLPENRPQLVATKPLTGYMGFAAAPTEIALAAMSLQQQQLIRSDQISSSLLGDRFKVAMGNKAPLRYVMVNHFEKGLSNHSYLLKVYNHA